MATHQFEIMDGPSKFDLMTALFVWKPERPKVLFSYGAGSFNATISAVEAEDGSGESWNIKGYAYDNAARVKIHRQFHGYFHTGKRRGYITFMA